MKLLLYFFILSDFVFAQREALIIDHSKVNEFNSIDEKVIPAAASLRLMFRHASVGTTINNGLDCIQGTRSHPKECTEYEPYLYDRRTWIFQQRGNSGWKGKVDDFVNATEQQLDEFDIFSFKFCYLDGLDEVAEPCGKPYSESITEANWNYLKDAYETLEKKYPEKIFIWWTIPLTQVGQYCTEQMNSRIRNYCKENGKILFDIADIESWDTTGNHLTNSQGWEIAFNGYCGEKTGPSCHPNWFGSILLAKAFWYMMVKIVERKITSVCQIGEEDLNVSPNPASDYIEISLSSYKMPEYEPSNIRILNILGECVYSVNLSGEITQSFSIDVSNFPTGLYFIQFKGKFKNFIVSR